jgi:hypothetical protein
VHILNKLLQAARENVWLFLLFALLIGGEKYKSWQQQQAQKTAV